MPAWTTAAWAAEAPAIIDQMNQLIPGDVVTGPITLHAVMNASTPQRQDLRAYAEGRRIHVRLNGEGWRDASAEGRATLRQNLAHELAHIWQVAAYDSLLEPRWIHEGFAEALAMAALERADMWSGSDVMAYRAAQDAQCAEVLADGPLIAALERDDRRAVYACGFVIIDVTSGVVGQNPGQLFGLYVTGMTTGNGLARTVVDATPTGYLRRVRTFLYYDFTDQPPERVIANFRSGRL